MTVELSDNLGYWSYMATVMEQHTQTALSTKSLREVPKGVLNGAFEYFDTAIKGSENSLVALHNGHHAWNYAAQILRNQSSTRNTDKAICKKLDKFSRTMKSLVEVNPVLNVPQSDIERLHNFFKQLREMSEQGQAAKTMSCGLDDIVFFQVHD